MKRRPPPPTHHGRFAAALARSAAYKARLDVFAEWLAEGYTLPEIQNGMGIGRGTSERYLAEIRKGLGWQAR